MVEIQAMRLVSVATENAHGYPGLSIERLSPRMNVLTSDSAGELAALGDLVSHLLLGHELPPMARTNATTAWLRGEVTAASSLYVNSHRNPGLPQDERLSSDIRLRRTGDRYDPKLTIAFREGQSPGQLPVAGQAQAVQAPAGVAAWHAGAPSSVLALVMFGGRDSEARRELAELLSPAVAATFRQLSPSHSTEDPFSSLPQHGELLRQRDELAASIESRLGQERLESTALEQRLDTLRSERQSLQHEAEELRRHLQSTDAQLNADASRLRYEELSRMAEEAESHQAAEDWGPRIEDLDEQITRWRATLAQLEQREAYVRSELAQVHPDDSCPELPLADQRASVAVAQRLVADLESEVARFARSSGSPLCLCADAHPRMNPLVEMLGQHIDRLADLVTQQDRALRTQELGDESEQLERSQAELRHQLEKLLQRRETLWRTSRARTAKPMERTADVRTDRSVLETRRGELAEQLAGLDAQLRRLEAEYDELSERRRRLFEASDLGQWRQQLSVVQAQLSGAKASLQQPGRLTPLRASDILAKLSDGELTGLKLVSGGRSCEVRNRLGHVLTQQQLDAEQSQLVVWALRLALADACVEAGVRLPLVLVEPFERLSDRHTANLAVAIDDFHRRGRQVLLFTQRRPAIERFRSLGVVVRSVRDQQRIEVRPVVQQERKLPAVEKRVGRHVEKRIETRVETRSRFVLEINDSIERFPIPIENRKEVFERARIRTVRDLVSADPSAVAEELAISGVTAELVALWQAHSALVCFLPGLSFEEAKVLAAAGVLCIEDFAETDADELAKTLSQGRFAWKSSTSISDWIELSSDELGRWRSSGLSEIWRRNRQERHDRIRENSRRRESGGERSNRFGDREGRGERSSERNYSERSNRSSERSGERRSSRSSSRSERSRSSRQSRSSARSSERTTVKTLKFYLNTHDEIEAAPSIGPKRAKQLTALGIVTVADLLAADPENLALQLDNKRIDAATIVAWQHQANLICCVPGLRGHDSQVLVGCGFTTPEGIATMKPSELLEFVEPFCDTPEGQRALRGSQRPDLEEVGQWIRGAQQRRSVSVA